MSKQNKISDSEEKKGMTILFGMIRMFFLWILRTPQPDDFIAKCFRDILDNFVSYEIPLSYLPSFAVAGLKHKVITIPELKNLLAALKRADADAESIKAVSDTLVIIEAYWASQN
jgi:hypothetical protein